MQSFKSCPQRHSFEYEQMIRPEYPSEPLFVGTLVHRGIEMLGRGSTMNDTLAALEAMFGARLIETDMLLIYYTVAAMLAGYQWRWQGDGYDVIVHEAQYQLPLRNPETGTRSPLWDAAGKLDKIVRLPDSRLAVLEIKTVGESIAVDSDYWRLLAIDEQISGYVLAARQCGHDVATVIYDVLRKPEISPRNPTYQLTAEQRRELLDNGSYYGATLPRDEVEKSIADRKESPRMYGARLIADMYSRPDFYFARREIPRIEADLASYEYDRWYTMQAIRQSQRDGRWPRYTRSCLRPYKCPYFEQCCAGLRVLAAPPSGFVRLTTPHPELEMSNGSCNNTSVPSAAPAPDSPSEGAAAARGAPDFVRRSRS